jgi:hypothetical protein
VRIQLSSPVSIPKGLRVCRASEAGSVLLVSLMVSGILGVTLASYLLVARSQHVGAVYSQSWHQALTLAEAGVEEALAKMNGDGISTSTTSGGGGTPSSDPIRRRLGSGIYEFNISAGPGSGATIYATGYVTIPRIATTVTRRIMVTTTNGSLFTTAVGARKNLVMTRNTTIFSDSFDSTDSRLLIRNNGEVACLAGSVRLGTSKIEGDLLLGPAGTNLSSHVTGKIFHDLNLDLPDVSAPSTRWLPAAFANEDIDNTLYRYVFRNNGDYTINSPGSIYVGSGAQVQLQIQSANFSASSIYVAGTTRPGKLVIYALQPGFTLNGNATVESGKPANLLYLGLPGNTSLTLNGNTNFIGTIYAPSANFTNNVLAHRGTQKATFTGSCIANSVQINGASSFRFDEDLLRSASATRGFIITSWKEL